MSIKDSYLSEQYDLALDRIAMILGISGGQVNVLDYYVDVDENGQYRINLAEDTPLEIKSDIIGLNSENQVLVDKEDLGILVDFEQSQQSDQELQDPAELFLSSLAELSDLRSIDLPTIGLQKLQNKLIFISVINSLELYLHDEIIRKISEHPIFLERFVRQHPISNKRNFQIDDLFNAEERVYELRNEIIERTLFHNMPVIRQMYTSTIGIEFPPIKKIIRFVLIRHDLVHRDGRTKRGHVINVGSSLLNSLFAEVLSFVTELKSQVSSVIYLNQQANGYDFDDDDFDDHIPF
jgi:hypothetical protein